MSDCKAESRKQSQCERILEASRRCFVEHGFHNASMAMISETAGMSPGLIYRYFENKNAIILAIVEAQLEVVKSRISEVRTAGDLAAALVEYFEPHDDDARNDSVNAPLFLDISAEATRDPEIGKVVHHVDEVVRAATADWFHRSPEEGGHGFPLEEAKNRALALILLVDGLKARKAREPDLDRQRLRNAIDLMVAAVTQ